MVTRADVAKRAGTSTAVVSYVINDGPRPVAAETRQRVLDAIAELGYRPNLLAQALRGNRSKVLGLVFPDIANPYYAELARAIEAEVDSRGYSLILCNSDQDAGRELNYVRTLVDRRVDGVVLISGSTSEELRRLIGELAVPCVLLDRAMNYSGATTLIKTDNILGGEIATRHLMSLGHRRIVALAGPASLGNERATGYRRCMEAAGLTPELHHSGYDRDSSYSLACRLLSEDRPPAIFAGNDIIAFSVLRAAADRGLRVPDDLAVVGFDDIREASYSVPRLTTVAHPIAALGRLAAELLIEQASGGAAPSVHWLTPSLVIRESCGAGAR
ncbi:LacI family DNA-binding transcriptional regulator [Frigidibacter sp. MR17.24]|uniref:LacI family DNA-binding transcriptional regulator n=1 Tax=Frigidibacter sp. MR17.24 TaxID=3127345 RepID=UPI0030130163